MVAFSLLVACAFLPHNSQPFVSEAKNLSWCMLWGVPLFLPLGQTKTPLRCFLPTCFPGLLLLVRHLRDGGAPESRRAEMATVKHMKAVKSGIVLDRSHREHEKCCSNRQRQILFRVPLQRARATAGLKLMSSCFILLCGWVRARSFHFIYAQDTRRCLIAQGCTQAQHTTEHVHHIQSQECRLLILN